MEDMYACTGTHEVFDATHFLSKCHCEHITGSIAMKMCHKLRNPNMAEPVLVKVASLPFHVFLIYLKLSNAIDIFFLSDLSHA